MAKFHVVSSARAKRMYHKEIARQKAMIAAVKAKCAERIKKRRMAWNNAHRREQRSRIKQTTRFLKWQEKGGKAGRPKKETKRDA